MGRRMKQLSVFSNQLSVVRFQLSVKLNCPKHLNCLNGFGQFKCKKRVNFTPKLPIPALKRHTRLIKFKLPNCPRVFGVCTVPVFPENREFPFCTANMHTKPDFLPLKTLQACRYKTSCVCIHRKASAHGTRPILTRRALPVR